VPGPLNYVFYLGEWHCTHKSDQYSWLTESQGRLYIVLPPPDESMELSVVMLMFDGEWQDDPARMAVIHESVYENNTISLGQKAVFYNIQANLTDGNLHSVDGATGDLSISQVNYRFEVEGSVSFPDQEIKFEFSARQVVKNDFLDEVVLYFVIYVSLAVAEFVAFSMHIEYSAGSAYRAKGISLLYVGMNASIDMALTFWHFGFIFTDLFSIDLLYIPCSCSLILCLIAINPLALTVWKAQNPQASYVRNRQSEEASFRGRYTAGVVLSAIGFYCLGTWKKLLIFVLHLFFIPQIVKNVYENYRHSIKPTVYILIAGSRFGVIAYYFGSNSNFLVWRPNHEFVVLLGVVLGLQIIILHLQTKYGPRFFLPKRWLDQAAFSYYRSRAEEELMEPQDCCICLNPLNLGSIVEAGVGRTVHTPCNHHYHLECLQSWISVNAQCPTCRRDIPEI
jgi:hypothetical protein